MGSDRRLIKGSIKDVAKRKGIEIAQAMAEAAYIILIDTSYSMTEVDPGHDESRHDLALGQLEILQKNNDGRLVVVSFSSLPIFCADGNPERQNGGTNLSRAIDWCVPLAEAGLDLIVISDGEPESEFLALQSAKSIPTKIHTVFIGPENGDAIEFMRKIAHANNGTTMHKEDIRQIAENVQLLLTG